MLTESEVTDKLEQVTLSPKIIEENYFEVILLDIKAFVNTNVTHCVKRNLYDKEMDEYICISYRWGEVTEWITNVTDYRAHIKSFCKADLWIVCKSILQEPDMKHIKYLWVDAICIDQINMERRKATIKKMSDIYELCTYILAVPDLHFSYLQANPGNNKSMDNIMTYGRHILYELLNGEENEDSGIWKKDIDCQLMITWILLYLHPKLHLTTHFNPSSFLNQLVEFKESPEYEAMYSLSDEINEFYESLKSSFEYIIQREKEQKEGEEGFYWYRENYFLRSMKYTPQFGHLQDLSNFYNVMGQEDNLELPNIKSLFLKLVFTYNDYKTIINEAIKFLDYTVSDWATRVWVVSEYSIAKRNQTKHPMKLTFVCLLKNICWQMEPPRLIDDDQKEEEEKEKEVENIYHRFFNIFDIKTNREEEMEKNSLIHRVEKMSVVRPLLHTILNSRASNHEDRFYATMNSWDKYDHHVKDKNTISSWNIKDIVDVRLQLYNMLDMKDTLQLLHACSVNDAFHYPSFATTHKECWLDYENLHYGNFDDIEKLDEMPKLELVFYQQNKKKNIYDDDDDDDELIQIKSRLDLKNIDKEKFTLNITSVKYINNKDKQKVQQLTLQCDIYYEVESINMIDGKFIFEQQSKGEMVIIPFYRFENMEQNKTNTPSDCYLTLYKKNKMDEDMNWMLKKGSEYMEFTNDSSLLRLGSFDIKPDGVKLNGSFTIE